jgi:type 1 glutamine amidotransferase
MKHFILAFFFTLISAASASNIVIMVVEDPNNYEAPRTMRDFAEKQLRPLGHHVTIIDGDKPQPHHFAGLVEALKDADLLVLFSRRRFPPKDQMAAIRAHLDAGKPLLGIRTANHAFIPKPKEVVDPSLVPWPEFTDEVLGAPNTGYETKGLPYTVRIAPGSENSPLLEGVNAANILGAQSLYKVLPLAADVTPLLIGTAKTDTSPPMPVAWTRTYGERKARIFYTSLGAPEDMQIADVRRLLVNAVKWTLNPEAR